MKKIIVCLFSLLLITGCHSTVSKKWTYDLENGYSIKRIGTEEVVLYKDNDIIIDKYITGFSILNNEYIYLQTARSYVNESSENSVVILYYLINMITSDIIGPFTQDNSEVILNDIGVFDVPSFIETDKKPEKANYD